MLYNNGGDIKIFSCNSNRPLAKSIADLLEVPLGDSKVGKFSDGEVFMKIDEIIRGRDVYIVQSTSDPVNDNLMELLIMIDGMKRASAGRITALIPYYGYARQDRKVRARDPISAKLVANLITTAGADRVLTMDLHSAQIQGFFDIPLDHLSAIPLFVNYYKERFKDDINNFIAVSPDLGSVARVRSFAERLDIPLAIIDKRRPKPNVSEIINIIGDVKGKKVIIVDDMIDTAGTICNAADTLLAKGALEVYGCCTHPVMSGNAYEKIEKCGMKELVVLDTIEKPDRNKIVKISTAEIFADAIVRINQCNSVSKLFD